MCTPSDPSIQQASASIDAATAVTARAIEAVSKRTRAAIKVPPVMSDSGPLQLVPGESAGTIASRLLDEAMARVDSVCDVLAVRRTSARAV